MSLPRKTYTNRYADLDFSMKIPMGFVECDLPTDVPDFSRPDVSLPLLVMAAPVDMTLIAVAARPAYLEGTVRDWLVSVCERFNIRLLSIGPTYVGGLRKNHPAIMATGLQDKDGTELVMSIVALEDGGRFVTIHAMCPREIEPTHMSTMEGCIHSFELIRHKGVTAKLDDNGQIWETTLVQHEPDLPPPENEAEVYARKVAKARDAAMLEARPLIASDRFDDAARVMLKADDSGQGRAALSELFVEALRAQVRRDGKRNPAKPRAVELYRRALQYRLSTYPDPHTQDEADRYESGMNEDRAEITAVLGYQPE